jgi:hypothetical protein
MAREQQARRRINAFLTSKALECVRPHPGPRTLVHLPHALPPGGRLSGLTSCPHPLLPQPSAGWLSGMRCAGGGLRCGVPAASSHRLGWAEESGGKSEL